MGTATEATTRPPSSRLVKEGEARTCVPTELRRLEAEFASPRPGVLVVRVSGELDLAGAPQLDAELQHEVHEREPALLVVDLSRLHFLGLQGVAVFERLRRRTRAAGIDLNLVALPPTGARALEFAGILWHYDVYPDVGAALLPSDSRIVGAPGATG
jgi:anti-sigma B factor antagonist